MVDIIRILDNNLPFYLEEFEHTHTHTKKKEINILKKLSTKELVESVRKKKTFFFHPKRIIINNHGLFRCFIKGKISN